MNKPEMSQETASELWQKAIELRNSDKKGKIQKAIKLVQRIIEERNDRPPMSTKLRTFVGDCYHLNLGQHDKAMEYYQAAIEDDSNDPWASIMLGEIYLKNKKNYKAAVDILEKTLAGGFCKPLQSDIAKDLLVEAKQNLASNQ